MADESKILLSGNQEIGTKLEPAFYRFDLTDCFFVTTFAAVFIWCASIVGFQNPGLWIALVIATLLGWLNSKRLANQKPRSVMIISGASFFFGGLCLINPTIAVCCVIYGLVALVCRSIHASLRTWQRTSLVITAIGFIAWAAIPNPRLMAIYEVREKYPVESLEYRLSYENESQSKDPAASPLSPTVAKSLSQTDELYATVHSGRRRTLERTHDKRLEKFLRTDGFGVLRMITPNTRQLKKPALLSLPFNAGIPPIPDNKYRSWQFNNEEFLDEIELDPRNYHRAGIFDFLDPESFGWVQEKQNAAGFIPHAFHGIDDTVVNNDAQWQLKELQLISLLKFDEPKAYVLDHLPRMDHLNGTQFETRSLDSFESASLTKLYTAQDLIIKSDNNQLRMLGSIRASNVCLECHSVERGDLLGAFTYRFEPVDAVSK